MKARFDELLPFYVNGSLGTDDRAWVEQWLEAHPTARAELDWYRSLRERLQEAAPQVPETIGLAKTMTLIRGDRPTWSERVNAFFGSFAMRPAMALAGLAVVAIQGGFILSLLHTADDDAAELRALRATVVEDRPLLKLNFAPVAQEEQIRHLLISIQGHLTGGPGQLGDYYVAVPAGKEAALAERLRTDPIVQAVTLAPGLPPRQ
ncbi:MAG: hypothetical protein ABIX12_05735 [Rubrivivax sp.]